MGKRKLVFAARKNFQRKKYTKLWPLNVTIPLDLVTVLPVHIPLDVTHPPHHAVCVTPDDIRQRVQARSSELPKGWTVIESPPSKLMLAKPVYVEARSQVTMTFTVVIHGACDCLVGYPFLEPPHSSRACQLELVVFLKLSTFSTLSVLLLFVLETTMTSTKF